jgi:Uma2 family endonuclease
MQAVREIVLPEAKPASGWIGGRAVQKVSPKRRHALLRVPIADVLLHWAGDRGDVGTEWRFRLAPPGGLRRPLVPGVAFLSKERLALLSDTDAEEPPIAPEIVVEILSPGDKKRHLDEKRRVYLACCVSLLLHVDMGNRRGEAFYGDGTRERVSLDVPFRPKDFPGLEITFADIFARVA